MAITFFQLLESYQMPHIDGNDIMSLMVAGDWVEENISPKVVEEYGKKIQDIFLPTLYSIQNSLHDLPMGTTDLNSRIRSAVYGWYLALVSMARTLTDQKNTLRPAPQPSHLPFVEKVIEMAEEHVALISNELHKHPERKTYEEIVNKFKKMHPFLVFASKKMKQLRMALGQEYSP